MYGTKAQDTPKGYSNTIHSKYNIYNVAHVFLTGLKTYVLASWVLCEAGGVVMEVTQL